MFSMDLHVYQAWLNYSIYSGIFMCFVVSLCYQSGLSMFLMIYSKSGSWWFVQ